MRKIVPFLIIFVVSCKSSESNTTQPISIDEVAIAHLGKNFKRSDKGEYSLCYSVDKLASKWKTAIVLNLQTGQLVYGPKKLNADIDWFSDSRLIIKEYPEVIQDKTSTNTFTYYYDLVEKKRISNIK